MKRNKKSVANLMDRRGTGSKPIFGIAHIREAKNELH
ncbi:hypothetical protein Pan54_34780 [Rubinisphaera italica]|uniref:Uncharacterized protein n=1 Tax=Rubinisphaera italica TaxID=2527969 RepID=A0A5C5XK43_9PLAN|nr:hypothetical protein Pan54_34780 [Rubinisphaera italica]